MTYTLTPEHLPILRWVSKAIPVSTSSLWESGLYITGAFSGPRFLAATRYMLLVDVSAWQLPTESGFAREDDGQVHAYLRPHDVRDIMAALRDGETVGVQESLDEGLEMGLEFFESMIDRTITKDWTETVQIPKTLPTGTDPVPLRSSLGIPIGLTRQRAQPFKGDTLDVDPSVDYRLRYQDDSRYGLVMGMKPPVEGESE